MFTTPQALAFMCGAIAFVVPLDAFEDAAQHDGFIDFVLARLTPEAGAASAIDRRHMARG